MATDKQKEAWKNYVKVVLGPDAKELKMLEKSSACPNLLHISTDGKIKEFIPTVTRRTMTREDRRVPRVSTSPTLLGCLAGYCIALDDFIDPDLDWKGGWYIYSIPFTLAAEPSKKLVPDVDASDERWVIPYDAQHRKINPEIVGKCFIYEMTQLGARSNKDGCLYTYTLYVDVRKPFTFGGTLTLEPGYYRVVVGPVEDRWQQTFHDCQVFVSSKQEYSKAKGLTASLLSFVPEPPSARW